ncbi:hypothetical protein [Tolypothrix sp. VBCCA 56010]|uniref:hypothetical protein n=1 Tax=Tolypothrix sp. VBCCA 56010 TaxID=3137731 RepID=UPI003D7D360D
MDNKRNKQWVGKAIDVGCCEIAGVYIGARDETACGLSLACNRIYGFQRKLIRLFYQKSDIGQLVNRRLKQVTLSASTTRYGSKCLVWCDEPSHSHIGAIWYFVQYRKLTLALTEQTNFRRFSTYAPEMSSDLKI